METINNLFYIIIFLSVSGSVCAIISIFLKQVMKFTLPMWYSILIPLFFLIPIKSPLLNLISPEQDGWREGFLIASNIWIWGVFVFTIYYIGRNVLACIALKKFKICNDPRVTKIYLQCAEKTAIKKSPCLLVGNLSDPACVITILKTSIILRMDVISKLSDEDIEIIIVHELNHILLKHHLLQKVFDIISCIHWFNPFVWIAKNDFITACEIDCDRKSAHIIGSYTTYLTTMLRLIELTIIRKNKLYGNLSILNSSITKQRFGVLLNKPSKAKIIISTLIIFVSILLMLIFSLYTSRMYFYPYPAAYSNNNMPEYSNVLD